MTECCLSDYELYLGINGIEYTKINAIHAKVELVIVCFNFSAVFGASVREHTDEAHFH